MNLVFLSPHFPPNFFNFCVNLHHVGVSVLGIGEIPFENLRQELKDSLTDYFAVSSLEDYNQVYRACGYFIQRHGRLNHVESHNETWLPLEAQLREDFNIPGLKVSETESLRRKSKMKEIFGTTGVNLARGEIFSGLQAAHEFSRKVGFPVFAKPDKGVGAASTYKIHSESELENFAATKPGGDYLIEEFIDGYLATFDGMTDRDGNIVYSTSHYSDTGVFEVVQNNADLNYYSLREIPEDILDYGRKAVKAFRVREKFFHIEYLRQKKDGRLVAMEINIRPPGGFTTDMMNFAADIDVYKQWSNIIAKNCFDVQVDLKYHCAHVARKWGKSYRLSHEEILTRFGEKVVAFSEVSQIFSSVMGNFAYLVRSQNLDEVKQLISEIQAKA